MGEVVNLNRYRKLKERAEKAKLATANRAKFGQSKPERQLQSKLREIEIKRHESNKLDDDEPKR